MDVVHYNITMRLYIQREPQVLSVCISRGVQKGNLLARYIIFDDLPLFCHKMSFMQIYICVL